MKMIKYSLLLAAVLVAFPAVAQKEVKQPVQAGELNNYEYRVAATDPNFKGKYKGIIAEAVNVDKKYALVMQILPGGDVHKFCTGNDEVCKSISNGVECGDTWPAWCYLPMGGLVADSMAEAAMAEEEMEYAVDEEKVYFKKATNLDTLPQESVKYYDVAAK